MCMPGLCTSTPAGGAMSAAVTSPGPCLRRYITTGSSCSDDTTSSLRLRMMSVTSSATPATVENSCSTPSILMLVTAAPGIEESRVRRIEFPIVYPNPGSRGSMTNLDLNSSTCSSVRVGRWAISITTPISRDTRYLMSRFLLTANRRRCRGRPAVGGPGMVLLRVQLDDELLLNLGIDLGPDRERVNQDTHLVRDHLDPRGRLALARLRPRYHERRHLYGLGSNVNNVALADPVRRDVDLLAVDQEVAVRHQLTGHVPATSFLPLTRKWPCVTS